MPGSPEPGPGADRRVPVAVVGLAALMPGARDAAEYWRNIVAGRDLVSDVPASHWSAEDFYDPDPAAPDKTYCRRGAFLPAIDFDPLAHGLPPATLPAIDPGQLLGLTVADALLADLEHGLAGPPDRERVSVILGSSTLGRVGTMDARIQRPVWLRALREQGIAEEHAQAACDRIAAQYVPWQEATFPGLLSNVVAGRIANRLDLHGTNCTIDAACASSLAAVSAAVNELSLGQADLVITGGVDATNNPLMYVCFSKTPALSPTGDARPFAEDADGTVLGEGLAMVALKRLDAAERDGDRIYAVIRGIGTSSDGHGGAIYAPVPQGQARALRRAYAAAGYGPETVDLVEAHGTATRAGDAAEFEALRQVFGESGRPGAQWCALGTVKSQIGHTKAAAGAAGLVKTVLALHHKVLPPTVKVSRPNPRLGLEASPFYLNTAARPWTRRDGQARRASVSSFGFGGANFHVALEEYPHRDDHRTGGAVPRFRTVPSELVLYSGPSARELSERVRDLPDGPALFDQARESQKRFDAAAPFRLSVVAADRGDLRAKLERAAALIDRQPDVPFTLPGGVAYGCGRAAAGRIAFVFPGQGAQYVGMGGEMAMAFPPAQRAWDLGAGVELGECGLHEVVFPPPAFSDERRAAQNSRLTDTRWAQPALAAHSLSLLALLAAIGVEPDCVAGHSLGELVALHAAGAMDAESLLRLARRRGELLAEADGASGAMLAVATKADVVAAAIEAVGASDLWLANLNAPRQTVASGTVHAIEALHRYLSAAGIAARRLEVSAAFHSPMAESVAKPLRGFLDELDVAAPRIAVYGNAHGRIYGPEPDEIRARLAEHPAAAVRFQEQIEAMYADGVRTFVEVGAGSALTGLIGQILGERDHLAVHLDKRGRDAVTVWHETLGRLAARGLPMDLAALTRDTVSVPPRAERSADRPRMSVPVDGTGYKNPEAMAAAPAPSMPAAVSAPAPAHTPAPVQAPEPDVQWVAAVQEVQRQTVEAHMHFQQVMADAHRAFLQMAESAFAGTGTTSAPPPALPSPSIPEAFVAPAPAPVLTLPPAPELVSEIVPELVPVPLAAPEPVTATPTGIDLDLLLSIVADKTGYPAEMLGGAMDLETDLGIDSIKKVEIFAALRERADSMPPTDSPQMARLFHLRTLDEIVRWAGDGREEPATPPPVPAPAPAPASTAPNGSAILRRLQVRPVAAPACGLALGGLVRAPLTVVDGGSGLAAALVARLAAHGVAAAAEDVPAPDAWGVILLGGMAPISGPQEAATVQRSAFEAARTVAASMGERGGVFVTVQDTGGAFGLLDPDPQRAWLGGVAALARTAAREWPLAAVKAVDCQRGPRDARAVAAAIAEELLTGGSTLDVGLRADGSRWTVAHREAAAVRAATPLVTADSVLVATGGARGVTAAALLELAAAHRPKILLVGRTALPAEPEPASLAAATDETSLTRALAQQAPATPLQLTARARAILAAREVRATLAALEAAGATVRYAALDATDRCALERELDRTRREYGKITGLIHAAGVLADKNIADKSDEQFDRVYATKVTGLHALLDATAHDPLDLLLVFSSVAARYGNAGQSDYAMANETLNQVAAAEQRRRPSCRVRSIGWGPWDGGMVTGPLAAHFARLGVPLIPLGAGARAFEAEVAAAAAADDTVQVLIAAGDDPSPAAAGPSVRAEIAVNARTHGYLADHAPAGVPVLPLALAVEWFAAAGRSSHPDRPAALRDLRVLSRVDLPHLAAGGHRFTLDATADAITLAGASNTPHYRARLVAPDDVSEPLTEPPPALRPAAILDVYDGTVLFHGPRFHMLRSLNTLSDDGAEAQLVGLRSLGWGGGPWWTDPAALDGALQTAVLWARHATGHATLPMAVDALRIHRAGPAPGLLRCRVRAVTVAADQARCDIALFDEDDGLRAHLLGLSLVRRPDVPSKPVAGTAAADTPGAR
jgi:acyl transferase domain-containing protein/NADP-dependent 3-hydroxy acid dehydrogenase YdfG